MSRTLSAPPPPPRIVAVGYRRINKMLQELAPEFASKALVEVLDVGFEQAVARIRDMQRAGRPVDVVVAAGSNGAYLRQHLDTPVVLVKVGGFDLMQALAHARRLSPHVGVVTYEGMAPELSQFGELFGLQTVAQRSYRTEEEAQARVRELAQLGVAVVVGTGVVADLAEQSGLSGVFLYSMDAVRGALDDAVEVARASRIEQAKRERLGAILARLSDGVIAVDQHERIQTLNPAMAQLLGVGPADWLGQTLSEVCPELSLRHTLRLGVPDLEKIERVRHKALIVNRMPIVEQGVLTGAVLSCQDPISIQRVDRHIRTRMKPAATHAPARRHELGDLLGTSAAVRQVRRMALQCARSQASVLLIGASGTGKELIAQGIHTAGDRRDMPFVAVNCAAMVETLLESELFGHEEGAFTGARRGGKVGLIEAAHNGTLFLDEVGEMPMALQTRLLRVLQEREVLRVGATEPTPVNVRVIAATHRDLARQVAAGRFRLDLFYRLNILRIDVPSLRDRIEDIGPIAHALQARIQRRLGASPAARRRLIDPLVAALIAQGRHYDWPGNVREMENLIERLVAYAGAPVGEGGDADAEDAGVVQESTGAVAGRAGAARQAMAFLRQVAPELFRGDGVADRITAVSPGVGPPDGATAQADLTQGAWKDRQAQAQRQDIEQVLAACGGDKGEAARRLGISRTTLWRKLKACAV